MGRLDTDAQVCLCSCMFNGIRWGKGEMEHFLQIFNKNVDWEIQLRASAKGEGQLVQTFSLQAYKPRGNVVAM